MSRPHKQIIKCPKCGKDIEFTLWQSINTEMDFAIPDIISGKLFEVDCKNCDFHTKVVYPILFNDMIHNVWVWLVLDPDNEENQEALKLATKNNIRTRIVTTQEDLREKTSIFNAGLDDRLVEIAKVMCEEEIKQLDNQKPDKIFFHLLDDGYGFECIVDDKSIPLKMPKESFEALSDQLSEFLPPDDAGVSTVDREWAKDFLDRYASECE